ncbi:hypothetical protein CO083_02225 [Candidatus Roizmanbacteria bacterium CG_4_9_14_0_8_um_filter_34_12]|uniref:Polymerase beta nucleotidyltransferase domain-containing protein n=1 Tax=Candidatus Roizmanbacteria bacterium CG_4_9_14_0_8_um_filter_34_12 TaxID=1974840 RepID=A0A2M8DD60_9BACT|nr:MAG: hypothetical protein CO083_02225 [Candidatus Roizmanbacteria bacterium CG_4_9_14_0_8_um_filter_34_12]
MKNVVFRNKQVKVEINSFVNLLQKEQIKISRVILFGSFAKGKQKDYSDIDLAVVSPDFGKDTHKEMMFLVHLSSKVSDRIEAIPVAEKDMLMKYHPLIGEIKKYGKIVYSSN